MSYSHQSLWPCGAVNLKTHGYFSNYLSQRGASFGLWPHRLCLQIPDILVHCLFGCSLSGLYPCYSSTFICESSTFFLAGALQFLICSLTMFGHPQISWLTLNSLSWIYMRTRPLWLDLRTFQSFPSLGHDIQQAIRVTLMGRAPFYVSNGWYHLSSGSCDIQPQLHGSNKYHCLIPVTELSISYRLPSKYPTRSDGCVGHISTSDALG